MGDEKTTRQKTRIRAAQASVELTALLGIFLVVILFYTVFASGVLSHIGLQGEYHDAYTSVRALASAADSVFSQGEGTVRPVRVVLPVIFNGSRSYIGQPSWAPSAPQNTISINVGGTDVFASTRAPLSGSFPNKSGEYTLAVISRGSYVSINSYIIDVTPSTVYLEMGPGAERQATLTVRAVAPEGADVNISSQWSFPHANLTITPARAITSGQAEVPVTFRFKTDSEAYGTHSSSVKIVAKRTGSGGNDTETISIPITLEVSR